MRSFATSVSTHSDVEPMIETPAEQFQAGDSAVRHRRAIRVLRAAQLLSFIWAALAAAAIYLLLRYQPATDMTLSALAGIAAGVAAPLCAIWLAALVMARVNPHADAVDALALERAGDRFRAAADEARADIGSLNNALQTLSVQIGELRAGIAREAQAVTELTRQVGGQATEAGRALSADSQRFEAVARALVEAARSAQLSFGDMTATLPEASERTQAIARSLDEGTQMAQSRLAAIETGLAALWDRNAAAQAQAEDAAATLAGALAQIDSASSRGAEALAARTAALTEASDAALTRASATLDAAQSGIAAQASAIATAIELAREQLASLGSSGAALLGDETQRLREQAEQLTLQLGEQQQRAQGLVEQLERSLQIVDAKLQHSTQANELVLDRLQQKLGSVQSNIHTLGEPLSVWQAAVDQLADAVRSVAGMGDALTTQLGTTAPQQIEDARKSLERARAESDALASALAAMQAQGHALAAPLDEHRAAIASAMTTLGQHGAQAQSQVAMLRDAIAGAQTELRQLDSDSEAAALGASTRLVEAMTRVRDVAQQAQGQMRQALDAVIDEARAALAKAGEDSVRTSVTDAVAAQLAQVEAAATSSAEAAQHATERLSRQLMLLTETAAAVETRITEADTRIELAAREDLARQSSLLIEALNSASIDVTKALSSDVTEPAWQAYLKGDRGVFTRRAVQLVSGSEARAIARQYESEPEFRDAVRRYVHDFETMMRRVMRDRDGNALSVALLSSDVGKLYVALAQAIDRIRS